MTNRLTQFYEEIKAAKEMVAQVLVRQFLVSNRYGGDDKISLNMQNIYFEEILFHCLCSIVSPNNTPRHHHRVLPSDNPDAASVTSSVPMASTNILYHKLSLNVWNIFRL